MKAKKVFLTIFAICLILFFAGGTLINLLPPTVERPQVLARFAELIGEDAYAELTDAYDIKFVPGNPEDGEIIPTLHEIRIRDSTDRRMLIALCHEWGHYVALRDDLAHDAGYLELFRGHEPIYYGNYDMTATAYSDINEFCASYIGMWAFNGVPMPQQGVDALE